MLSIPASTSHGGFRYQIQQGQIEITSKVQQTV